MENFFSTVGTEFETVMVKKGTYSSTTAVFSMTLFWYVNS